MNTPASAIIIARMLTFLFPAVAQVFTDREILEAEQARQNGVPVLLEAAKGDFRSQMLAARAIGRLENPVYRDSLIPLLDSPDPQVRRAAAGGLAQMRAPFPRTTILKGERDALVRAAIFEAIGRAKPIADDAESVLAAGLKESDSRARASAARGLESLFRLNSKPVRNPAGTTLVALHEAFAASLHGEGEIRELILLTMHAVGDRDSATLASALADPEAQVRRLAVLHTGKWLQDSAPMVRYEALRSAPSCDRAVAALKDTDDHVALAAVDLLGSLKCDASLLTPLVSGGSWRIRAHALVALATVDPVRAQDAMAVAAADSTWQMRAYAAKAARLVNDSSILAKLARDENPNVAISAMATAGDASRALRSEHAGLIRAGAEWLKNTPDLKDSLPQLVAAFKKMTAGGAMHMRDARVSVLTRIGEIEDPSTEKMFREALDDHDPAIAALAARILTNRTGVPIAPQTTRLPIPAVPPADYIVGLAGAMARITMRGIGSITVDLLTAEAPVTVAVFAQLAEAGKYNGLTFHRIVPNFVIQGGSPGADEYDGRSHEFMRDEVGFTRNARGTIGISTRGRDTGDAQIYFNLVDNFRLDRDYTVFATMRDGLTVMDRVQEGDVIDRIEIIRLSPRK